MEQEKNTETDFQKMQPILQRIKSNTLHISRIPQNTKDKFIELANEQFCGDYGFCLKAILDGLINPDYNELYNRYEELEQRTSQLELSVQQLSKSNNDDDEDQIKMANGKVINKK